MMRRFFYCMAFGFCLCSCTNSSNDSTTADSSGVNSPVMSDTNNASKNTGTDMSGGVNSGNFNKGDTTGIDINADSTKH